MAVARRLGRYTIGEQIGSGGLAEVFAASAEGADGFAKRLVVKRIRADLLGETGAADALRSEARLAQRLSHGNVVHVFDYGQDEDGSPYIVMEHVNGCSLRSLLEDLETRGEALCLADALFVVEEVAAALHYAHGLADDDGMPLGIVHRDVKPGNILVSREGVVKLTDFGIAKTRALPLETIPGLVKGTPRYLAPEQAAGRTVDARADVYGLGVVLLDLLGEDADPELKAIGKKATEPAPRDRYEDVDAMAEALHGWRAVKGMRSRPARLAELVRRAQGHASKSRPIALDAALLGGPSAEPDTVHVATRPERPPKRWPIGLGVGVVAIGLGTWWVWPAERGPAAATVQAVTAGGEDRGELDVELAPDPPQAEDPEPPAADPELEPDPEPDAPAPPPQGDPPDPPPPAPVEDPPAAEPAEPSKPRKPGRLQINLLPYAQVTLDGRKLGRTPIDKALKPGRHRLVLHNPGTGKTVRRRIEVKSGKEVSITSWE